jgi:hypothetical protein
MLLPILMRERNPNSVTSTDCGRGLVFRTEWYTNRLHYSMQSSESRLLDGMLLPLLMRERNPNSVTSTDCGRGLCCVPYSSGIVHELRFVTEVERESDVNETPISSDNDNH